jgi:hypothetical protein
MGAIMIRFLRVSEPIFWGESRCGKRFMFAYLVRPFLITNRKNNGFAFSGLSKRISKLNDKNQRRKPETPGEARK